MYIDLRTLVLTLILVIYTHRYVLRVTLRVAKENMVMLFKL